MDKTKLRARIGEIQRIAETVMFPIDDLWYLSAEENICPTKYTESELEAIERALEATAELTALLQDLKTELQNEQKVDSGNAGRDSENKNHEGSGNREADK